jgi:hypothetical protein
MPTTSVDFTVKSGPLAHRGLTMGLCPGEYQGKDSSSRSVFIAEAAFGPLEEAIRRHAPAYARPYAHYGVTAISRDEWLRIIEEWDAERIRLQFGSPLGEKAIWWFTVGCEPQGSSPDLDENKQSLIALIQALSEWLRTTLEKYDQVCILGI